MHNRIMLNASYGYKGKELNVKYRKKSFALKIGKGQKIWGVVLLLTTSTIYDGMMSGKLWMSPSHNSHQFASKCKLQTCKLRETLL